MKKIIIPKNKLKDLYINKRLSSEKCGNILGCSASTIIVNLRNYGIRVRTQGEIQKGIPKEKIKLPKNELHYLYLKKKWNFKKCADYYHCGTSTIQRRLKEYGIRIRKNNWNWYGRGHPITEETRKKLSIALKKSAYWKGKKFPPELKRKLSESHKKNLTKEMIRQTLKRRIPTTLENRFLSIIRKYNLPYKYVGDGSFIIENCNPDFININGEKIAIEVYARYFKKRNYQDITKWKIRRQKTFAQFGWKVLFFDETEVREDFVLEVLRKASNNR